MTKKGLELNWIPSGNGGNKLVSVKMKYLGFESQANTTIILIWKLKHLNLYSPNDSPVVISIEPKQRY
jgi:hypothetical protein